MAMGGELVLALLLMVITHKAAVAENLTSTDDVFLGGHWFVSHDGDDDDCVTSNVTCRDLVNVVNRSEAGDTIFVDGLGRDDAFYVLCLSPAKLVMVYRAKSLRIIGYNGRPIIGCSEDKGRDKGIAMLEPDSLNETCVYYFEHVQILNGTIWVNNCSLYLDDVVSTNSTVLTAEGCGHVAVAMTDSAFYGTQNCSGQEECTQHAHTLMCSFVHLTIQTSKFYQSAVLVRGRAGVNITVRGSLFSNLPSQVRVLGGLHFTFFALNSVILIEDNTFDTQIHPTKVHSVINLFEGAIWLKSMRISRNDMTTNAQVVIRNCVFHNNERGVIFVGPFYLLLVDSCVFSENIAMQAGGALLVLIDKNSTLHVLNSVFRDNVAGSFRRDYPVEEEPGAFTEVGHEVHLDAECCKGVITLVGKGGAIRIQRGDVKLSNCTFVNNTAKLLGGSIFVDIDGFLHVENSSFYNTDVHNHSLQGDILYSDGKVTIYAVVMKVETAQNGLSILRHSGDHWSMDITNVWIECPVGYNLRATNSSAYGVYEYGLRRSYQLDQLSYFCESCPRNKYSLDHGTLNYTMQFNSFAYYTLLINGSQPEPAYTGSHIQHDIQCDDCPYGGHCVQGITSVANFWGYTDTTRATDGNHSYDKQVMRFQHCPRGYCCSTPECPSFDTCVQGRHGCLCGRCQDGLSEAVFSAKCIPDEQCGPMWLASLGLALALGYSLFLMFQVDLKNFLFSESLLTSHCRRRYTLICKPYMNGHVAGRNSQTPQTDHVQENGEDLGETSVKNRAHSPRKKSPPHEFHASDSGFLIILFYYFQDALLLNVQTVYVSSDSSTTDLVKSILSGLFKFHLDNFELIDQVCIIPGMTPVTKLLAKALDVPCVILIFIIVFGLYHWSTIMCCRENLQDDNAHRGPSKKRTFIARLSSGFILALLFTFQKMGTTTFTLLNCVPVEGKRVLFIDGWVECYQYWQYGVMAYALLCVTPFFIVLLVGPSMLYHRRICLLQFFLACLCPLPFLIYWGSKKLLRLAKKTEEPKQSEGRLSEKTRAVIQVVQGPFKDNKYGLSWAGVLIGRRLILILLFTFVNDSLIRLLLMLLFCFIILLHHVHVQPYKDRRGNIAGTTSAAALVTLGIINLVRAGFEAAEYRPTGPNAFLMRIFEEMENTLLLWVPLFAMSGLALLFVIRLGVFVIACCSRAVRAEHLGDNAEKEVCISMNDLDKRPPTISRDV